MVLDALGDGTDAQPRQVTDSSGSWPIPTPGQPVHFSVRFTERLDEIGARSPRSAPSPTPIDNALAETTNGLFKAECVYGAQTRRRCWDGVDELELATLSWVHWFNEHRLHSHC